jgi:hypothetical protein
MKTRTKTYLVSRERAIKYAMNHNCVSREIAERYTDVELKEVLRHMSSSMYRLKPDF